MNLLEALEKKKALESALGDRIDSLDEFLDDSESMSKVMTKIDSLVDTVFNLGRKIERQYNKVLISKTESISDVISYIDGLTKKINVLRYLLLTANKREIDTGEKTSVSAQTLLTSIQHYEALKNSLVSKVKDVCFNTELE